MKKLQASVYLLLAYSVRVPAVRGHGVAARRPAHDVGQQVEGFLEHVFLRGPGGCRYLALPQVTPFIWPEFRPALLMTTWMLVAATSASVCGTVKLIEAISEIHPDRVIKNSFFRSLHEVPRDFQFYVHAGAKKDCKPYI